ncbi:MAG: helix-turn-helix transcriptional regulator [Bacteroidales bacterium]
MGLVNSESKLSDIIISEPSVITVLNRFNIKLGVGDKTIQNICNEMNIDIQFFVTILNTYINKDYFPEATLKLFKASSIISYLVKTNNYYAHFQLANIERHFHLLMKHSDGKVNNLPLMLRFFNELKEDVMQRINYDNTVWFPHILSLEETGTSLEANTANTNYNDTIEEKLNDLKSMLVIHLSGDYDQNLCHAVIFAIISLEKDIIQNNRIRYRILGALCDSMTKGE